jgi:ATP-dependent DNA ligase
MNEISLVKKYKNSVIRQFIFIPKEEINLIDNKKDWWVSKKIDGQLWFYVRDDKTSKIINSNESDISNKTNAIIKELDKKFKLQKNLILAGELYFFTSDRERYGDTISCLGDNSKLDKLRYGIFDIVYSEKTFSTFQDKYNFLLNEFEISNKNIVHTVEQIKTPQNNIGKYFIENIEKKGFEGLIVRDNSTIYKIKTEETGDFLITGFTVGEKANYIRSVSLGVYLNDHEIIHVGSCGSFASEKIKKDIYDKLSKLKVSSNFQKISSEGTPYIFVKPQVVVEVKLLEMQGDRSNDQPIRHFKYEFNNNKLTATGKSRSVSILNSRVVNIREDKKASFEDCGLKQIIKLSGIPKEEFKEINLKDLPKSKVVKKEIYFKDSKNGKAIKKFIFWKSNKEKVGDYPSYLCYYLDYSDGREDPIKKKIYPFEDEKIGLDFLKSLMDENIKKGWEKFNGS